MENRSQKSGNREMSEGVRSRYFRQQNQSLQELER